MRFELRRMSMRAWIGMCVVCVAFCGQANAFGFGNDDAATTICVIHDPASEAGKCHNGEVLLYQPRMFGNEQLPVIVSAALCDFDHTIVYNKGGVSCVFTDKRKASWVDLGVGSGK